MYTKIVFAGDGGNSVDGTRNGSVMNPFIFLLFRVGLVAVGWFASSAETAPVLPSSLDVELVDIVAVDGDEIVQSSMITPFPSGNGGLLPDEPNFFWSGSGDDPDAGMTYWITTTIYKTAVVTMTPSTPKPTIATTSPTITPTPPMKESSSPPITWPVEAFQPRNWIRTIIRSDMNETSPRFHQLIQSRLGRMYSDLLQQRNVTNVIGIGAPLAHVIIHNITRRSGDIDVIYSLSTWHHQIPMDGSITSRLVEPYLAVAAVRRVDVTRQLCHRQANDTQEMSLCLSVVNQAEPFSRAEETSVATTASTGYQYWIVGVIVGVLLIVIVIVVFIYFTGRKKKEKKRNNKRDVAVGESSPPNVPQSESVGDSRSKAVRISKNIVSKLVAKGSTEVEEDPDPWVRKARSTSKKQRKHKLRPQTAPERNAHRQSSSSLSAILSGSTSSTSSSLDRMEYRLSREEPVQPSRGARRLKRKRTAKTDVLSPERAKHKKELKTQTTDASILKTRRWITTSVEMETQEVMADFSDCPDTPDDVSHEVELILTTDDLGWQPGSLIPSCVTAGVFGSRKISSAPVVLESAGHTGEDGRQAMKPRRAWSTPDHVQFNGQSKNVENIVPIHYESSNIESSDDHSIAGRQQATHLKHPALHIHSISYPTWPSLSDTDPAIELIRTIKDELKKFEPKVS